MSDEFGANIITLEDEDGQEVVLEELDTMEYKGKTYGAYLPTDIKEDDPDYGMVILQITNGEDGETYFDDIEDDEELNDVYEHFMLILYGDED